MPVVLNRAAIIKSIHFHIEIVESYNYLETILNKKWLLSITPIELIRRLSSIFCLRKLVKFQTDRTLLKMFYQFVQSVLTFSFICWFLSISIKYTN